MGKDTDNLFKRKLILATNQFISHFPDEKINFQISFSAGLPHFAIGWSRCWGRDTFISNELLLKHPNIYHEVILQFASVMRHGMIPNLLDSGKKPRYNCRDACWWFIRGVKEYARKTGDYNIFKEKVNMVFLSNDLIQNN
eukprot:GHVR01152886.1.p1 GENE.GHVR01152886.1~~GHVR01152886.1.p1  ORF type:complete len:140 (+),score=4.25 GHVR01152886.1:154-573(+)